MNGAASISNLVRTGSHELPPRILLISDETLIRLSYQQRWFRGENYIINFASSSSEALVFLETYYADLIIVDIASQGKQVIEFFEQSMEISPDTLRIVIGNLSEKRLGLTILAKGAAHQLYIVPWDEKSLHKVIEEAVQLHEELVRRHLRYLLSSFAFLPSRITSQYRLRQLLESPDSSLADLTKEVEKNPGLAAKILQVVNSSFYGIRQQVVKVKDAIILIGTEYIETLLLTIELFEIIYRRLDEESRAQVDLIWHKALRRAQIAREIAESDGLEDLSSKAFITALLQDVGYLIRLVHQKKRYYTMIKIAQTEKIPLYEADRRIFAVYHEELGATLLKLWSFPDEIINVVSNHHNSAIDNGMLSKIILVAEALEEPNDIKIEDENLQLLVNSWYTRLYSNSTK